MVIEIVGDTVKSAVGKQIKTIFPEVVWYKDSVTNVKYPNFFVNQLQIIAKKDRQNRWILSYLFSAEYTISSDLTTVTNINSLLDAVGIDLLYGMDVLTDIKAYTTNQRIEKVPEEGKLAFIFNVDIFVRKEVIETLQKELTLTIELENRE